MIDCYNFILLEQESDGGAILEAYESAPAEKLNIFPSCSV